MENQYKVKPGDEVIGEFKTGNRFGLHSTSLMFPHGTVVVETEEGIKVDFPAIKGLWKYKHSQLGKIVHLKGEPFDRKEEQQEYAMEAERLGLEEEGW